jgi:hypothetical protein
MGRLKSDDTLDFPKHFENISVWRKIHWNSLGLYVYVRRSRVRYIEIITVLFVGKNLYRMRFEIFMAVEVWIVVFLVVIQCRWTQ